MYAPVRFGRLRPVGLFLLVAILTGFTAPPLNAVDWFGGARFTIQCDDGKPVAGAIIDLFTWDGEQMTATDYTLRTDADGTGEFDRLPRANHIRARIRADGYATELRRLEPNKLQRQNLSHVLSAPARASIKITDPAGNPVTGAEIRSLDFLNSNGNWNFMDRSVADVYLADFQTSGADGVLALPTLPSRSKLTARVIHPNWAQAVAELDVVNDATATIELEAGVPVSIRLQLVGDEDASLEGDEADVLVDFAIDEPGRAGSFGHRFKIANNQINFTTGRSNIEWVEVLTNRFFVGPQHVEIPKRTVEVLASAAIQPTIVTLHVHPKVTRRGRVVDHRGRPMKGVKLAAILIDHGFDKPDATITERQMVMTSLGETRTDKNGEYQIELAPGTVLISAVRENYFPTPLTTRLEVQLENDERISDIVLHPIPALRGHVRTADQQSANDVIVKFETHGRADDEVMGRTNEAGEFQLRLPRIPYIDYGLGYDTIGYIAAMDPEKQVGGIVEVDLTDPEQTSNIVVNMEPQSSEWFFRPLPAKPEKIARLAEYVTAVRKKFSAGIEGNTVPAMSEGTWINTDATSLADFRGKFVLLDFWFIGCVPCEQAFPELKIVQQSFPSDQFAIVGVHPNSSPVDEVVEFVKQRRIPFAMVVDDRAGSIVKQYAPLGLSSYPEFILIDPNGRIVHNDAVCTGVAESDEMRYRSLRDNKLDLIREAIQNWDWERN